MAVTTAAVVATAASAYSAYSQGKAQKAAAKAASKPRETVTTRVPYMNQYLDPIFSQIAIPDALSMYNKYRGGSAGGGLGSGLAPNPNYDSLMKMLQGMSTNQVGYGGSGLGGTPYYAPRPANPNLIRTNPDGSPMVENPESFYNYRVPSRFAE